METKRETFQDYPVYSLSEIAFTLNYGNFIQTTVDFLIVALCIFGVIKLINKATSLAKKKEEEAPAPAPEPTKEEVLLTEIRDILKQK